MIFISRKLRADGPLRRWAAGRGEELTARSLLRFDPVPYTPPPDADWWFFYSSRAVEFGLSEHRPPSATRLAAIGPGTAEALREHGLEPDFTGTGNPEETAAAFAGVAAGDRVFFPRARQSRLSIQTALVGRITVLDAVCYDNVVNPPEGPILADTYVYTSPLNVAAYLDHWEMQGDARVVAIGPSTAAALRERGIEPLVAGEPTEEALVGLLSGN